MSYVDYSTNFLLDQFFTYIHANTLGANDEHLYDTIAVGHNINTSTIDGTHKTNAILGANISKVPTSTGNKTMGSSESWLPVAGIYQFVEITANSNIVFEILIASVWYGATYSFSGEGIWFFDGANMRIRNTTGTPGGEYRYQKF